MVLLPCTLDEWLEFTSDVACSCPDVCHLISQKGTPIYPYLSSMQYIASKGFELTSEI